MDDETPQSILRAFAPPRSTKSPSSVSGLLAQSITPPPWLIAPPSSHSYICSTMNIAHPALMSSLSPGGLLALASCSSHVPAPMFNELCEEAVLGGARRQATVLAMQVCVRR